MDYVISEEVVADAVEFTEQHKNDTLPVVWKQFGFFHIAGHGSFVWNCKSAEQAYELLMHNFESYD